MNGAFDLNVKNLFRMITDRIANVSNQKNQFIKLSLQ